MKSQFARGYRRLVTAAILAACGFGISAAGRQQSAVPASSAPQSGGGATEGSRGTALIMGRVVDGSTARPVANALVTLSSPQLPVATGPSASGAAAPPRVITTSSGQFVFRDLPAGSYTFTVTGSGAQYGGGYGVRRPGGAAQPLDIAAGDRIADVTLRVWKFASISGTVVDQHGDPLVETRVSALKVEIVSGRRQFRFNPANTTLTDDRGMYRLSHLEPGDYVAYLPFAETTIPASTRAAMDGPDRADVQRALGLSGGPVILGDGFRVGDLTLLRDATAYGGNGPIGPMFKTPSPASDGSMLVYPFQYFPNASRPADGAVITIESGQDHPGADFQARLVPSVRVSGHVSGPDGPVTNVGVRLVPQNVADVADESAIEAATTAADAQGDFTFLGVPAGTYVLKVASIPSNPVAPPQSVTVMGPSGGVQSFASAPSSSLPAPTLPEGPTLFAFQSLTIGSTDITGLGVKLQTGARISGRLEFEGPSDRPTADQLKRLGVSFDPLDGHAFAGAKGSAFVDALGEVHSMGLLPGKYTVSLNRSIPPGWTLKSAIVNGRDATDLPLTIDTADVAGAIFTLTDHPSALSGAVHDPSGVVAKDASVLLFPVDRTRWIDIGANPRGERLTRASASGAYRIAGVPAGEYFVIAIDDQFTAGWQDPARLAVLSRDAARIVITDGQSATQDLTRRK